MPIRRYYDFDAWKLADAFKSQVLLILKGAPAACRDLRFRTQLIESARAPTKHIAEGFLRKSPATFIRYLDFAISSLGEASHHLQDGIEMGYFAPEACAEAFSLCRRSMGACLSLKRSQIRYLREQKRRSKAAAGVGRAADEEESM